MNRGNVKKVLDKIKSCPEQWNQKVWHCGTARCFFGHAQIMAGKMPDSCTVMKDGTEFFGMTRLEAEYFSHTGRTLAELETALSDRYAFGGIPQG